MTNLQLSPHHLIFEGAELTGKSYLISKIYNHFELKYNTGLGLLDGCYWFNCDVGIFGGSYGLPVINKYIEIAEILKQRNIIYEKFHLTNFVNGKLLNTPILNHGDIEKKLKKLNFKIIFLKVDEDEQLFQTRIQDRLKLYPHYQRILHKPSWYIQQQRLLLNTLNQSILEHLVVDTTQIPNQVDQEILTWLGELD